MAYAAAVSLAQTTDRLRNSYYISNLPSFPDIVSMYDELKALQKVLLSLDSSSIRSERLNTLDGDIREAVFKLEDAIETLVSNQLLSHQSHDGPPVSTLYIDLKELKQDLDSFKQMVKKMKEDYAEELSMPRKVNDDAAVPSTPQSGGKKSNMVGFSLHFSATKYVLIDDDPLTETTISLYGMAGIGKTTLAREIFEDPEIVDHFECRAWVRVGLEYQRTKILHSILCQVLSPAETDKMLTEKGEDELAVYLWESLQGRGCLIVLDDIWESQFCTDLKQLLPDNGIRILVTTTIQEVADRSANFVDSNKLPFLDKEESWCLLREEVFGEEESLCPHELKKPGKKIAEKCDGLPLLIVTVAAI